MVFKNVEGLNSSVNTEYGSCIEKVLDKEVGRVKLKEEHGDVIVSVHIMLLTFIVVGRLLAKVKSAQDKQGKIYVDEDFCFVSFDRGRLIVSEFIVDNRHVSTTEENQKGAYYIEGEVNIVAVSSAFEEKFKICSIEVVYRAEPGHENVI